MAEPRKRSARRQRALAAQKQKERQQMFKFIGIAGAVALVLGALLWFGNRPKSVDGDIPMGADGTAWGPLDAPVLIEEWSDFN